MTSLSRLKRFRTPALIAVAIAATAGISGAVGASAAVKYLVAGGKNATSAPTYINNSRGTPLALNAKTGYAPLAVGTSVKVRKLNADYLDGLDSSGYARTAGKTGVIVAADGPAVCPAGTVATGGGGDLLHFDPAAPDDATKYTYDVPINYSGPAVKDGKLVPNSWIVLPPEDATGSIGADVFVVCYSPTGAVPGAASAATVAKLAAKSPALKATLDRR